MAVSGTARGVSASVVTRPSVSEEEQTVKDNAALFSLLRATGKKIEWNTSAITSLEKDISDIRHFFSESVDTASNNIDQIYRSLDTFSDISTKDKPDDYDELLKKVSDIKKVQENQTSAVSLLAEHDITPSVWKGVKDDIFNLQKQADSFCLDNRTVNQVDLGTVTRENIGVLLAEKVKGTFGAVTGQLEEHFVSGWWFKTGDSGSGMLFCPATGNVFSLFKSASSDLVDIRIIFGPDLGDISDLSTAEQNFVNLLKTTGLTAELWNKVTADVAALQEVNTAVKSFVSAGLNAYLWKKMLTSVSDISCDIAYPELSVKSWEKVVSALLREDTDELYEKEKELLESLMVAGVTVAEINNAREALADCKVISEKSSFLADLAGNVKKLTEDISALTESFSVIKAVRKVNFTLETWKLVTEKGGLFSMTQEERNFLNNLMASGFSKDKWDEVLSDIVELQTSKTFLDQLVTAGLTAEAWTTLQDTIETLRETKTFIDALQSAGFSEETWSKVYAAALAADSSDEGDEPTGDEPTEDDKPSSDDIVIDGTNVTISNGAHYDEPLGEDTVLTVTNEGYVQSLHIVTDTPLIFGYNTSAKGIEVYYYEGDTQRVRCRANPQLAVTLTYNSTTGYSWDISDSMSNLSGNYTKGAVTYNLTNSVFYLYNVLDLTVGAAYIFCLGNSKVEVADGAYTLSDFNGIIRSWNSSVSITVNGKNHVASNNGVIYCADETVRTKLQSINQDLLKYGNEFHDVFNVYSYNLATDTYGWESDFSPVVETEPVTVPLGDEDSPSDNMALRVFRAYFKALCSHDVETLYAVNKIHNIALSAIGAKHDLDYYVKKFVYTVKQLFATYGKENFSQLLKELCNIDLENNDSGAIIGLDAGGALEKQYKEIIQDPIVEVSQEYPADVFTAEDDTRYVIVKGITFVLPSPDTLEEWQKRLVCELAYWYFEAIMNVLEDEVFGVPINFSAQHFDNIIKVILTDDLPSNVYARTSKLDGYVTIELSNSYLSRFNSMSGKDEVATIPPDNGLFHEMVHVYQEVNMLRGTNHNRLKYYGSWFVEGGAEFASAGIDHSRAPSAKNSYDPSLWFVVFLTSNYNATSYLYDPYTWGTIFMRWYFKTLAEERTLGG